MKRKIYVTIITLFMISFGLFAITKANTYSNIINTEEEKTEIIECIAKNLGDKKIAKDIEYYPESVKKIIKRGEIIIAVKQGESYPFFYTDENGDIKGLDFELGCNMAKALGVKAKFIRNKESFNDTVNEAVINNADIAISKISLTTARSQKVLYSTPYAHLTHGFLINRSSMARIKDSGDKYKKTISYIREGKLSLGVIENSSYEFFANKYFGDTDAKIVPVENWDKLKEAVIKGDIDIAYRDIMEVRQILKNNPELVLDLKDAIISGTQDNIAIVINNQNKHLKFWIDTFLDNYLVNDPRIESFKTKQMKQCRRLVKNNLKSSDISGGLKIFCDQIEIPYYNVDILLDNNFPEKSNLNDFSITKRSY